MLNAHNKQNNTLPFTHFYTFHRGKKRRFTQLKTENCQLPTELKNCPFLSKFYPASPKLITIHLLLNTMWKRMDCYAWADTSSSSLVLSMTGKGKKCRFAPPSPYALCLMPYALQKNAYPPTGGSTLTIYCFTNLQQSIPSYALRLTPITQHLSPHKNCPFLSKFSPRFTQTNHYSLALNTMWKRMDCYAWADTSSSSLVLSMTGKGKKCRFAPPSPYAL